MFVRNYKPFLNITIDSETKKKIWLNLVSFLDSAEEFDENDCFIEYHNIFNYINSQELEEQVNKAVDKDIQKVLNFNDDSKNELVFSTMNFMKMLNENDKFKQKYNEAISIAQKINKLIYPIQNEFEKYLALLNEDYKKYIEGSEKIAFEVNHEVKNKLGYDITALLKNLNNQ